MRTILWFTFFTFLLLYSGIISAGESGREENLSSPDGKISLEFMLQEGVPNYSVSYDGTEIIQPSSLGFRFKEAPSLDKDFAVTGARGSEYDESWSPVWGTDSLMRNRYNQLTVDLQEKTGQRRKLTLIFRAYNDGIAFRYLLPEQPDLKKFEIVDEETLFRFAGDYSAWWIPANWDSYEQLYSNSPISRLDSVNTPITMETQTGICLSLHEADLIDYAGMTLARKADEPYTLKSELVPWPNDSVKVKAETPHKTPWRTIQIANAPGRLIESHLIQNLNEPNVLQDVSWIKPMKYVGIWWGMHLGKDTWAMGPQHGATTENAKRYIDFASSHHIGGLLVEGWNAGWENWGKGNDFDFLTAYPDYDLKEVVRYAKEKGVALIVHNETGSNVTNYVEQMDSAFSFYQALGVHAIKTGYVGAITPDGQHHHGQWMVNHYRDVVKKAAEHQIMLDVHEPIKPTGESRTYPNMMTREGVRGTEYEAWSSGNPPEHTTILPFTRMLAGPIDYTPGIFDLTFNQYRPENRVHTTLAKQLALYVVIFCPVQMAADLIENYENQPAFAFIENVPVTWQETRVLNARIGDYVTIVRRNGNSWFMGSITDESARKFEIPLGFLKPGMKYVAHCYADRADADWESNPAAISIHRFIVDAGTILKVQLAKGGGQAIRFSPANEKELSEIPGYQSGE